MVTKPTTVKTDINIHLFISKKLPGLLVLLLGSGVIMGDRGSGVVRTDTD